MARGAPPRSPRERDSLAPAGLPRLLDLEVPPRANGSTAGRLGAVGSRAHHGDRESAFGARHASMARCSSSASRSHNAPLPDSCRVARSHPLRPGARSYRTTSPTLYPSTSLSCRPRPSGSFTCLWSCCIIAGKSCTSTSPSPPLPVVGQNSVAALDSGRQGSEAGRQMPLVFALLGALRAALGARTDLVLENLALRQQLALLRRRAK